MSLLLSGVFVHCLFDCLEEELPLLPQGLFNELGLFLRTPKTLASCCDVLGILAVIHRTVCQVQSFVDPDRIFLWVDHKSLGIEATAYDFDVGSGSHAPRVHGSEPQRKSE